MAADNRPLCDNIKIHLIHLIIFFLLFIIQQNINPKHTANVIKNYVIKNYESWKWWFGPTVCILILFIIYNLQFILFFRQSVVIQNTEFQKWLPSPFFFFLYIWEICLEKPLRKLRLLHAQSEAVGGLLMVWAAISCLPLGPLLVLDGRVTAKDYWFILEDNVHPVGGASMSNFYSYKKNDRITFLNTCSYNGKEGLQWEPSEFKTLLSKQGHTKGLISCTHTIVFYACSITADVP